MDVKNVDSSTAAIMFFATLDTKTGKTTYPATYKNLRFKVQCGDDPVQNLWVKPTRVPGQIIDLR